MGTVLITGASSGIGQALRWALGERGHEVIDWSRHSGVDIREIASCNQAAQSLPVLDGVVHNAGIYRRGPAPFYETLGDLEESFQTNVMGAANVQYVLWRAQRLRDHGTIGVMLTKDIQPMVGRLGVAKVSTLPNQTAYNVSKLALYGLVRSWVSEYMYSYKFLEFFPSPTLDTGMYDPQLGPAVHTLEQTVTPIAERIDRCIRIQ